MKKAVLLVVLMIFCVWANAALAIFSDVPRQHPNSKAIDFVREQGIVSGYQDGTFKPNQQINRAEFTKIIIGAVATQRGFELSAASCFPDVNADAWFAPYVCAAKNAGVISGFPDGSFKPVQNISFAEAAKIVANSFELPAGSAEPWYQPFFAALKEKNAIPSSISDPGQLLKRGEMAEVIFRLMGGEQAAQQISVSEFKQEVIELTNFERLKAGLSPLKQNSFLEIAAQGHADDMQQRDYFAHDTPEGTTESDRIKASGYLNEFDQCNCNKSYQLGENLAKGQSTPAEVLETWMNSPPHKENILHPNFSEIGIGISAISENNQGNYIGYFWVQTFGDVDLER